MQSQEKPPYDTHFAWIGGEAKVKALVERFYDLMDLEPGYAADAAALAPEARSYTEYDFRGPTALVLGTEADGLTPQVRAACDETVIIPMMGRIDSLNVSVAGAVLAFEAVRQRSNG